MEQTLIAAFGIVLAISVLMAWLFRSKAGTVQSFFWGDQNLSWGLTTSLILTSSFSLNGLLYQAWLGYTIGWWSLLVQLVWCSSFIFLGLNAPRFRDLLSRGTMHGIIASRFGGAAGRIAAFASIIGFGILIGWEAVVGATLLKTSLGANDALYVILPLVLVFIASFYSSTGGLRGNAYINAFQNLLKGSALIAAVVVVMGQTPSSWTSLISAPVASMGLKDAIMVMGGVALVANLAFSLFWQPADMSVWQNLSATKPDGRTRTVWASAIWVFLFPGLIGSTIGVALSAATAVGGKVTDTNILNHLLTIVSSNPIVAFALIAAFAASMLSTIDGYALAAGQAGTWDILFPGTTKKLLALGETTPKRKATADDGLILNAGRVLVLLVAMVGASSVIAMVIGAGVSLFDLVYIVVIAQMSLVGPVLFCLARPKGKIIRLGWIPIVFGLSVGGWFSAQRLLDGESDLLQWAPLGAILGSLGATLIGAMVFGRRT